MAIKEIYNPVTGLAPNLTMAELIALRDSQVKVITAPFSERNQKNYDRALSIISEIAERIEYIETGVNKKTEINTETKKNDKSIKRAIKRLTKAFNDIWTITNESDNYEIKLSRKK
jgi:hypothetical protein